MRARLPLGPGPLTPRVSVLLPVRDGLAYLPEAVTSVLDGTLRDLELIAVDDGSTDGSGDWLDRLAASDARVRVVHTPPLGVVSALQKAVEVATTAVLARMDADDVSHPERLALQADWLDAHPGTGLVACQAEPIGEELGSGTLRLHAWQNSLLTHESMMADLFVDAPFPHDSVTMRRSALERAGGYRSVDWLEDWDLWHRMAAVGVRFDKIVRPLLKVRDHAARVTRTRPEGSQEALLRARVHYLLEGPLRGEDRVVVWGAGSVGKRLVRALQAAGVVVAAIVDLHPRKIGRTIHGAPCVEPGHLRSLGGLPLLAAVGKPGARADIRRRCSELGVGPPLAVA